MTTKRLQLLAIPGSLRDNSSSNTILRQLITLLPPDVGVGVYDGVGALPHFNDSNEVPEVVDQFRQRIHQSDGVIICQPEYAFGVAGSLKNALDWTVGSGDFVHKPVALVTAATVGENAHAAMLLTLTAMTARILDNATLVIPFVKAKLNPDGTIKDSETEKQLSAMVNAFVSGIRALQ